MIEQFTKTLTQTIENLTSKLNEKLPEAKKTLEALIKESGGISGLIQTLRSEETQSKIKIWMKDGKDFILSQEQVKKIIGDERIQKISETAKVAPEKVMHVLTEVLPPLITKLEAIGSHLPDTSQVGKLFEKIKLMIKK